MKVPERRKQKRGFPHSSRSSSKNKVGQKRPRNRQFASTEKNRKRRKPLSPEAVALTKRLQELSRRKDLDEALKIFNDSKGIFDAHHACIVVDCCARCGKVQMARRIVESLKAGASVEVLTALLKCYSHAGEMESAMRLFRKMTGEKKEENRPNVRTLNTFLRGCLWTAAIRTEREVFGGVVSSEQAWKLFTSIVGSQKLDVSSYEYSIVLLCQALRTDEAKERLSEFQRQYEIRVKGKASLSGGDQSSLEGVASSYLALCRAHVLRGEWDEMWAAGQRALSAVRGSRFELDKTSPAEEEELTNAEKKRRNVNRATGGKQAWRKRGDADDSAADQRRSDSNIAYRKHRLTEAENEVKLLLKLRKEFKNVDVLESVRTSLTESLFYYSGGGTTVKGDMRHPVVHPEVIWHSFGLSELKKLKVDSSDFRAPDETASPVKASSMRDIRSSFKHEELPVDVELGSGFGDWIVRRAHAQRKRNHVAVELRADRLGQTFARSVVSSVAAQRNLCLVGASGETFLRQSVKPRTLDNVFVNHPEPPTQTHGIDSGSTHPLFRPDDEEPSHILRSSSIDLILQSLKKGGRMVVVSDNRWYTRFVCATAVHVLKSKKSGCFSVTLEEMKDFRCLESFGSGDGASI